VFVQSTSRLSQQLFVHTTFPQDLDCFRSPQQFCKRHGVYFRIRIEPSSSFKRDAAPRACSNNLDAPPIRQKRNSLLNVAISNDQRCPIKHRAINRDLHREAIKCICVTLDFKAMKMAVHDGYIDTTGAMTKAKFIQHQCISIAMMLAEHLSMQGLSHVPIAHDFFPDQNAARPPAECQVKRNMDGAS
jgi:hypothetical protein